MSKEITAPYGISLWRSIRALWPTLKNKCSIKVADGSKTDFWKDTWLGIMSLQEEFPNIFNLMIYQNKTLAEQWTPQGWDITFRRLPNDWELSRIQAFYTILGSWEGPKEGVNSLGWNGHNRGAFTVNSAYQNLKSD